MVSGNDQRWSPLYHCLSQMDPVLKYQ